MNASWSNCSSVTQLFVFLVRSVAQPSWEQLILVAPESTVNHCKARFAQFPVFKTVIKCPYVSSSDQGPHLAGVTGQTILILLCDGPLNMYLLSTLSLEGVRNFRIFVLSPAGPVFPSLQAWPQVQKQFTHSHIFLFKYEEENGFYYDLHSVFRLKNETLTSPIPGTLRFGEDQLGELGGVDIAIAVVKADFYKFDADVFVGTNGTAELRPSFVSELFHILPAVLNFTAVLWVSNHWGIYDAKTSSWRGMIGDLVNGDADLALSSCVHNGQRREVVDFNIDLYNWKFLALFRQPDFRRDSMAFLRPFDRYVWVAMMLSIIFLGFATFGIKTVHEFLLDEEREEPFGWNFELVRKLFHATFHTLALLCGVGLRDDDDEMTLPVKVLVLSKSFLGVVLYAFYGGMLISFLAVADVPFSTLEQLLATPYRFDAMSGDPFLMLQGAASSSVQKVVQRINQPLPYVDVGGAREDLIRGQYVFLAYDMNAYYDMSRKYHGDESCSIGEVDLPVDGPKLGTAMLKGSPLLRIFDYVILKCKVYGLDDRWIRTYLPSRPDCMVQKSDEGIPINSVMVPIYILAFGMTISFVMLLAETITHWHITSNERIRNSLSNPLGDSTASSTVYDPWHDTISLKSIAT